MAVELINNIDPAFYARINRGLGAKRFLPSRDLISPAIKQFGPPYHWPTDLRYWINWQRLRRINITRQNAVTIANNVVAQAETVETGRLYRIWEDTRFMPTVRNALAIGAACAGVGAGVGALVGGFGSVIGAAVGLVVGTIAGLFTGLFDWKSLFDDWRNYLQPLTVEERYMHFGAFRRMSNSARAKDERPNYPNWVLSEPGSVVRGGLDNGVFILYQALWEINSVPDAPGLRGWGLAAATVELSPGDALWRGWCHDHCGTPWLQELLLQNKDIPASTVRQNSYLSDVSELIVPTSVKDALATRYRL